MAFSAAALSFLLEGLDKPVIFTGSQIPLVEVRSDGRENLITSMLIAARHPIPEVCLFFGDRIFRGNRATKVSAGGFDAFDSPNFPPLGEVGVDIYNLVKSPMIGINYDTGNSYLAGTADTYEWLERVKDRLVHLHAKDISFAQSGEERGKVTGTPVGCACGDGVVDWKRVIEICKTAPNDIVFSVEVGNVEDRPYGMRDFEVVDPCGNSIAFGQPLEV